MAKKTGKITDEAVKIKKNDEAVKIKKDTNKEKNKGKGSDKKAGWATGSKELLFNRNSVKIEKI